MIFLLDFFSQVHSTFFNGLCSIHTVMAQMVSVLMDSVNVLRIGDTATRKQTKMTDGFTYSLTTTVGEMEITSVKGQISRNTSVFMCRSRPVEILVL